MIAADRLLLGAAPARDAGYDVVLLAHVLAAAVGLGAVVLSGSYAWTLRRSGPGSESIRRYYRPGVNWAGRVLFLIPVLGVALIAMSHGDYSYSDGWIMIGLASWAGVAVAAELYLWPAERRLQEGVSSSPAAPVVPVPVGVAGRAEPEEDTEAEPPLAPEVQSECLRVAVLSAVLSAVLLAAAVRMVAKP